LTIEGALAEVVVRVFAELLTLHAGHKERAKADRLRIHGETAHLDPLNQLSDVGPIDLETRIILVAQVGRIEATGHAVFKKLYAFVLRIHGWSEG
jgi:hypothetical protein